MGAFADGPARRHLIDRNAVFADFFRQDAHYAVHAAFAGHVSRLGGELSHLDVAETWIDMSDRYVAQYVEQSNADLDTQYTVISNRILRGEIARMRGQFAEARALLEQCLDRCPSLSFLTRVHVELALIEHLAGNVQASRLYEEKGARLLQQLAVIAQIPSWNCLKVIEHLKQTGRW